MSDDLISRKALAEQIDSLQVTLGGMDMFEKAARYSVLRTIDEQPSVDPHKHGQWIWRQGTSDDEYYLICSRCKSTCHGYYDEEDEQYLFVRSRYCPNCGAKMDGGEEQ